MTKITDGLAEDSVRVSSALRTQPKRRRKSMSQTLQKDGQTHHAVTSNGSTEDPFVLPRRVLIVEDNESAGRQVQKIPQKDTMLQGGTTQHRKKANEKP